MKRIIVVRASRALAIVLPACGVHGAAAQRTGGDTLHASAALIRAVTESLTSPRFQGRGTGQPGGDRAAEFIAGRLRALGLAPGGDSGSYFQTLPVAERIPLPSTTLHVGSRKFVIGRDFGVAEPPPPYELSGVSAATVFVGYGVVSSELHRDDLAGIDVKGKIVVMLDGSPKTVAPATWERVGDQRTIVRRLTMLGASGFIVVYAGGADRFPFPSVAAFLSNRTVGFIDRTPYPVVPARWAIEGLYPEIRLPPSLLVNDDVAAELFVASGRAFSDVRAAAERGEFVSRPLAQRVAFAPHVERRERRARNVVARIEGSDPALRGQAVVYTAHYDAYGIDPRGTLFPGAADNALGVGKLFVAAAAFAKESPRPRRSIIFIVSTGEEYGDLGIGYWLKHPSVPLPSIAANINYDGSITEVWGPPAFIINYSFGQSDMGPLTREIAGRRHIEVIPDPIPGEDYFSRGDHAAFVQQGIPALYLVGGPLDSSVVERAARWQATTYHMPSDSVRADWDWTGPAGVALLGFEIGRQLAGQDAMPQWRPGSKYNHARGTALRPPAS